ncbi:hypothetical protein evm_006313 [Chilo suppressalis]|nr:hypothetical protein evm_006313 [Chilo suppressalis]
MVHSNINEALTPIAWLAGQWVTKDGKGYLPNVPDFRYHEDLEFSCIGQPMFNFQSKSAHPENHSPMHQERGFLRIKPGTNELAFIVSHNFGMTSIEEGRCDPEKKEIVLETVSLSRMSFAKPPHVTKFKRIIKSLNENSVEITLFMETEEKPLFEHLKATYVRK